jgi:hypothetical protein
MANTNVGISNFVVSQSPFFVRNDHPNFIKFVEAYYEYLEQEGKTVNRAKEFRNALDIDKTIDLYAEKLYSQFLALIPKEAIVDKSLILKHAKDLYRARGTEKSIEFLLAILFDTETQFYYPKKNILKASDGKWYREKSLKLYDIKINNVLDEGEFTVKKFDGTQIVGQKSNAIATVESVDVYYQTGVIVKELKISNQIRDFAAGESISTQIEDEGEIKTISANVFSGIITRVDILNRGNNYVVGDQVTITSNTGSGGVIIVSSVTSGAIKTISVLDGGAGFQNTNSILITGGGGFGASGEVLLIEADESVHPNSYNIVISLIGNEANTNIGNALYSNLVNTVSDPANNWIGNSMFYFKYANTGPIKRTAVSAGGNNYTGLTSLTAQANTRVRNLGILGKMKIISAGTGYAANDEIEIINQTGILEGAGSGARGYVASVNGTGAITGVKFKQMPGHYIGGSGYSMNHLPRANVITSAGNGANIVVSAVLGDGEVLSATSEDIGTILSLQILSGGSGYDEVTTLNLSSNGSGTAQAVATIVQGVYTYPGRYLNDDGHLSGFSFLQDGKYYHNYSYVVRLRQSINDYKKALKDLVHPAGMNLFGEYLTIDEGATMNVQVSTANSTNVKNTTRSQFITYSSPATYNVRTLKASYSNVDTANVIIFRSNNHGISRNSNTYIIFTDGDMANTPNTVYVVSDVTTNTINIPIENVASTRGNAILYFGNVTINLANHGLSTNDLIYMDFATGDLANLSNATYTANKISNNFFSIDTTTIAKSNGTANVWLGTLTINRNSHGFAVGNTLYFEVEGNTTPNIVNGGLIITAVNNVNSFNVLHTEMSTSRGYNTGNAAIWLLTY